MKPLYLLDTSILSQLGPDLGVMSPSGLAWLRERESRSHISVISVLEIERGLAKVIRRGHSAKAKAITHWVEILLSRYSQRIIDIDRAIAQCAGRLEDAAIGRGFSPGMADALIAACAVMYGGIVVTKNLRHFQHLDVECVDPFLPV